ncbi:MAG TPA: hypothetical protein VL614_13135 [Acetobacteraceae bacterium]|nr:hypothetical protein [Acetobacteraceae bacterium]
MAAQFTFASMIHRGFLADANASTAVQVTVAGKDPIVRQVPMMTPGDVTGIPARQVIRCAPANGVVDAEPNYLATIDFDAPDLPWMFSRKPASGPIQPWIALAVIDLTDLPADPLSASPIGTQLTIAATQLPNPAESWMWAHGQLLDTDTVPGDPARSLSRLVSSRKLEQNRRYLACVVPVFAASRTAGLGTDPGDSRTSMDFAWDPTGSDVTLPVYFFWRFATGPNGDFESLVRQLKGVPLPPEIGTRTLVLDYPMNGMPAPDPGGAAVDLQVALRAPGATPDDIQAKVGTGYLDTLRSRLADAGFDVSLLTADPAGTLPAVGPPVYGQLAVGDSATVANLNTTAPPWLRSINLDPRLRVAAGLGAEVVRQNRDRYVEEAWRQVGDVLGANSVRRRAEFSLAASGSLHRKWISRVPAADLVTSIAPVHARIFVGASQTITGRLRQSPLPPSIISVEFRRATRTRGRLATALSASVGPAALGTLAVQDRPLDAVVALDTIDVLNPPSKVWGTAAASAILARLDPRIDQTGMSAAQVASHLDSMSHLASVTFVTAAQASASMATVDTDRVLSTVGMRPVTHLPPVASAPSLAPSVTPSTAPPSVTTVPPVHAAAPPTLAVPGSSPVAVGTTLPLVHIPLPAASAKLLKQQMTEVATLIINQQIAVSDAVALPQTALAGGFDALRQVIVAALDPAVTTLRMANHRITGLSDAQAAGLSDIIAAPDLSEPTYQALAAISPDWLLPGIDKLPTQTTTLVESNRSFISAFLVGVNHELARQLLWIEYPTDQRGTYSRQFWAHRNSGDPADAYDLTQLLSAASARTLEQLSDRSGEAASPLVLVVKGALVQRYPGLLVTAAKTKVSGSVRALDPATEIQPDFMALLEPDVLLVGFESLSADDVRALAGNADSAWWFFFAEHFTEPRFGLDVPAAAGSGTLADWNDATWGNAILDAAGRLSAGSFGAAPLPKTRPGLPPGPSYDWRSSSSSIAWILLQYPFRRGIRAIDLLPPKAT